MSAGALWEYGIRPVAVWGPQRQADGSKALAVGEADPDAWESVGDDLGAVNIEAIAAARPDVIVTASWGNDGLWGIDKDQEEEIRAIAPIIGIRVDNTKLTKSLKRFADVAEAFGADLESKPVRGARQRFDDAAAKLQASAAAAPDLKVGGTSGDATHIYVAVPKAWPDLSYYQSLGVNVVVPKTDSEFWESLSWEQATKYPVDLVLADSRGGDVGKILRDFPAATRLVPAIAQGQIASWEMETGRLLQLRPGDAQPGEGDRRRQGHV